MSLVVHLGLLGIAIAALGGASLRCVSRLCVATDARILGASALFSGLVIAEPLLIGLTGHGASPYLLTAAALVTWLVARLLVGSSDTPLRHQLADAWASSPAGVRVSLGILVTLVAGITIHQMRNPLIGYDGLVYHVAEPAVWIGDGHPGSFHQTVHVFPTQAYPKSFEMIIFWFTAISRSPATLVPLMMAFYLLAGYAIFASLRRVGCVPWLAALATTTAMVIPWNVYEFGSAYNDVATFAYFAAAAGLCLMARSEPAALGFAVVASGVSVGIKTTTVPLVIVALVWAGYHLRQRLRPHALSLGLLGALGIGLGGLWYTLNLIRYHAPLWPFSSFPDGPPQPYLWRTLGATFLHDPSATAKALEWHTYREYLGGELILLAAIVVIIPMAFLPAQRGSRRLILFGCGLAAAYAVVWSDTQFTGISHEIPLLAYSTLRYLNSAPVIVAVVLALVARERGVSRWVAVGLLGAALVFNLVEDRHLTTGLFPSWPVLVALVMIGVVGGLLSLQAASGGLTAILRQPALAPALAIVGAVLTAVMATNYLQYYVVSNASSVRNETPILDYLRSQPAWMNGHAPVAAGDEAAATFAGPTFNHPLSYMPRHAPCSQVREAATTGWLIMWPKSGGQFPGLAYPARTRCLRGITPVARLGFARIYAPPALVTPVTP
jgi:hypothetical protein